MTGIPEHSPTPPIEEQEPTAEGLIDVLTDLPLIRTPNLLRDEYCKRCDEKNSVRLRYGMTRRDGHFDDGERVRLSCWFMPLPEDGEGWVVSGVYHLDHPMKPKNDVARPGAAQAQVTARLDVEGWTYQLDDPEYNPDPYTVEDRSVVRNVEVVWFSPVGFGEVREASDDDLERTDPRPHWPDEENEWREAVMREHGDWTDEIPNYGYEELDEVPDDVDVI